MDLMSLTSFPNVDLFSAGINALNGVLVARNPSHNRGYSLAGLVLMAFLGGIGGGVSRDLLLNEIPAPIRDWRYWVVCVLMGLLGVAIYRYADSREEHFRTRTLAYFKSFSLPWFAVLGAHKTLEHGLGFFSALLVGLLATTAGGVLIDLFSGVTPEIVRPCEHVVTTALLASGIYASIEILGKGSVPHFVATLISVLLSFTFRIFAVREHWPQIVPLDAPAEGILVKQKVDAA